MTEGEKCEKEEECGQEIFARGYPGNGFRMERMDSEEQCTDERNPRGGSCTGRKERAKEGEEQENIEGMKEQIIEMEEERIKPEEGMLDLESEQCQRDIKLRIEGGEDFRGEVRDAGILENKVCVIPIHEFCPKDNRPGCECQCDEQDERYERTGVSNGGQTKHGGKYRGGA